MIFVLNFKNKIDIDIQKKLTNLLDEYNDAQDYKLLIAPNLLQKDNFKNIDIVSQNISIKNRSVGDLSVDALKYLNIKYCFIGHLERQLNKLDDLDSIRSRLKNALENSIVPILCIGIKDDSAKELEDILKDIDLSNKELIIAYEDLESTIKGCRCYSYSEVGKKFKVLNRCIQELKNKNFNFKPHLLFGGAISEDIIPLVQSVGYDGVLVGDRYSNMNSITKLIESWDLGYDFKKYSNVL